MSFFPATGAASEGCSEERSIETQAAMPEEDISTHYTGPDFENPCKNTEPVPEKVFALVSLYRKA